MRRLLSLVVALVLVMGTVSVFAASADWNGQMIVKYRNTETKVDDLKAYETYFWQKIELYPTWTLNDKVAVHASFFSQNYWGGDRLRGWGTSNPMTSSTNALDSAWGYTKTGGALEATVRGAEAKYQTAFTSKFGAYNGILGINGAWVTLNFLEGKLSVDIGRRNNPMWGEGIFLGDNFNPDRIFITYKTPAMGGLLMPVFIYERRQDLQTGSQDQNKNQVIPTLIYLQPGKKLFALTFDWTSYDQGHQSDTALLTFKDKTVNMYTLDFYGNMTLDLGGIKVKPTLDVVFSTGTAMSFGPGALISYERDVNVDSLSALLKVKVEVPKTISITPEFVFQKAPKKSTDAKKQYWNLFTAGVGGAYTIGNIYGGNEGATMITGGANTAGFADPNINLSVDATTAYSEVPSTYYLKINVDFDVLSEVVPGLSAYAWFIMAGAMGKAKLMNGTEVAGSDKSIGMEISVGAAYELDSTTLISADFAYAKAGENTWSANAAGNDKTSMLYFGMDLKVKF